MRFKYFQQPLSFLLSLFILLSLLSASLIITAEAASISILVDFEGGAPGGWFTYNGASSVSTTTQTVAAGDLLARPGQVGDNEILAAIYTISDFGGFGQDVATLGGPQDWSNFGSFSFWFYGSGSGLAYQAEISDNRSDPNTDTSERFDYTFVDSTPGWQLFEIPFSDFTRATDFQPSGAPNDGFTLTEIWAWAVVLPVGSDTVYFDDFGLGRILIDDFESGLPVGTDGNGISIGFFTFSDGSPVAISTTGAPPAPVPDKVGGNSVLQLDANVTAFAGFVHAFENATVDTWVFQDWSTFEGLSFWLYGDNSGTDLFVDVLENRNPGSTTDDAERWTVSFKDDFSGWKFFELPFASFTRKEIGNGAPNDGLSLTDVYGWAFGTLNTGGPRTYYLDDVGLYGVAEIPELAVTFSSSNYNVVEGQTGAITVKLNRPMNADDPAQVSVDYTIEPGTPIPVREYHPAAGTLTFINGGPAELSFPLQTVDDNKYEGDERVILRLSNPVDVAPGFILQASGTIVDNDPYDSTLLDDFERYPYLWDSSANVILENPEIAAGDPLALPDQGAYEHILKATVPLQVDIEIQGRICNKGNGVIPVVLLTTPDFDATTVDHTTVMLGEAYETHIDKRTGEPIRHEEDADGDGDIDLVFHFRFNETGLRCDPEVAPFNGWTYSGQPITAGGANARFGRDFALGEDWSFAAGLKFYYFGQNTGDTVTIELLDNRSPAPGPQNMQLVWTDEFNDPAGTPPNPAHWGYEIGDGTLNGIPGWGNDELQYYSDDPANAATDGNGDLVLTVRDADDSLQCYYGPCEYTSARLVSKYKAEFAYGRIEARIQVPSGDAGLWPAFWSLGTDIDRVGWPQTGEIDFMEYVSRLPNEIFGTIHGPGYSGGQSFGNVYDFGEPVYNVYHTFAIEWEPDLINWYVDGILYHTATPGDVAPNQWVFNDPVYLLLNVAVGGNFGGAVSPNTTFPQEMRVDYVRVYQGPDTAERYEAAFVDDFSGWQEINLPFEIFTRSTQQPAGAPNDGLGLTEVWGYGFRLPDTGTQTGSLLLDQVRLSQPTEITVTNTNDSGPGSLRQAVDYVASGGLVTFDPGLTNSTITLTSGPVVISGKEISVDGSGAPGLAISGGGVDRVFIIDPDATATISYARITEGFGWQLAGGILNNGALTLEHVNVTGNTMATDAGDFWQGGGGIYNGDGASLNLIDSTVADNTSGWAGGGVYSYFNTTTTIVRSTISGNTASDVGGGIRMLADGEIINSTLSGNKSTGWYGGALFLTDGVLNMTNTTVAENVSPPSGPAVVFVGTFGASSATLNLANSIIANNVTAGCFLAPFGSGVVAINSLGYNVFTDDTCFPIGTDQIVADPGLGSLDYYGGPTMTHALLPGSPAIDAAEEAICPATDQRGVARPQGSQCDVGAFELEMP